MIKCRLDYKLKSGKEQRNDMWRKERGKGVREGIIHCDKYFILMLNEIFQTESKMTSQTWDMKETPWRPGRKLLSKLKGNGSFTEGKRV